MRHDARTALLSGLVIAAVATPAVPAAEPAPKAAAVTAAKPAASPTSGKTPTFSSRDILDESLLRGKDYVIEDPVPVVNSRYQFTLRTPYGQIPADGKNVLQLRISEVPSIARAEAMSKESQELKGVKDSIKNTGKGIGALFTDPGGAISSVPKGFGRKVKEMTDKTSRKAGGESGRKFAAALGCDPETRNPVLKKLLKELSLRRQLGEGLVSVAGTFATGGMAMVAQGSSAMRTTAEMQETLRSTPLYKINEGIRGELIGSGVPKELAEKFIEHESYTTVQRLLFLAQFRRVERIPNAVLLVEMALQTKDDPSDEAAALDVIRTAELLANLNAGKPVQELLRAGIPAAKLRGGGIVVISPADYLVNTREFAERIAGLRAQHAEEPIQVLAAGRVSPEARATITAAKAQLVESGDVAKVK